MRGNDNLGYTVSYIYKNINIMDKLPVILAVTYLLGNSYFLLNCLKLFKQRDALSPEEMFLSLVISVIVIITWPVVIPISLIQSWQDNELTLARALPASMVIFISLLTLSGVAAFAMVMLNAFV